MFYIFIEDGKINGCGQCQSINDNIINYEVSEEIFYSFIDDNNRYIWDGEQIVENPNYEQEQQQKEVERIARLHLTRGDVFRGLLQAKGVTRAQLRAMIEQLPEETPEEKFAKEMAFIDFDEALEFYRGVALIDTLGQTLGISSEQMTRFFETNDFKELITAGA